MPRVGMTYIAIIKRPVCFTPQPVGQYPHVLSFKVNYY